MPLWTLINPWSTKIDQFHAKVTIIMRKTSVLLVLLEQKCVNMSIFMAIYCS